MDINRIIIENGVMLDPKIMNDDGVIDLFEHYENLPQDVLNILDETTGDEDYDELYAILDRLKPLGYTFEIGMCGSAYNLRELREDEK